MNITLSSPGQEHFAQSYNLGKIICLVWLIAERLFCHVFIFLFQGHVLSFRGTWRQMFTIYDKLYCHEILKLLIRDDNNSEF